MPINLIPAVNEECSCLLHLQKLSSFEIANNNTGTLDVVPFHFE